MLTKVILTTDYCMQQIWRWMCSLYRLVISKPELSPSLKKNIRQGQSLLRHHVVISVGSLEISLFLC